MSNGRKEKYDIVSHVEHLRTIHFSLLVACLALFIADRFIPTPSLEKAAEQIDSLQNGSVARIVI